MKVNKSMLSSLVLLIVVAAFYRIIPNRPFGFAPHIAMALFAGAVIKDKKWAFALPVFSIFLSDMFYEILYANGLTAMRGFYDGQLTNYILFAAITCIGFLMKNIRVINVLTYSLVTANIFFLASNFTVWLNGAGLNRSKTWSGLLQCYTDALPFYRGSLVATVVFSTILFGSYYLLNKPSWYTRTI